MCLLTNLSNIRSVPRHKPVIDKAKTKTQIIHIIKLQKKEHIKPKVSVTDPRTPPFLSEMEKLTMHHSLSLFLSSNIRIKWSNIQKKDWSWQACSVFRAWRSDWLSPCEETHSRPSSCTINLGHIDIQVLTTPQQLHYKRPRVFFSSLLCSRNPGFITAPTTIFSSHR